MIHYHGCDGIQIQHFAQVMQGRHAFVSFATPRRISDAAEVCKSFALDNGAFSAWKSGKKYDHEKYLEWISEWCRHPAFDWCLIPDKIAGTERDNLGLINRWTLGEHIGVPVWHLHESITHLQWLTKAFPRVAIGSSGEYATIGTQRWWERMNEAMIAICDEGKPPCKLHGLRMLNPEIFTRFPFASADSCNVAMTYSRDKFWGGAYKNASQVSRGNLLADTIEQFLSAPVWLDMPVQAGLFGKVI